MDPRTKISRHNCTGWGCGQKENGFDSCVGKLTEGGSGSFRYKGAAQFTSDVLKTHGVANHIHSAGSAAAEAEECYGSGQPFFYSDYKL